MKHLLRMTEEKLRHLQGVLNDLEFETKIIPTKENMEKLEQTKDLIEMTQEELEELR